MLQPAPAQALRGVTALIVEDDPASAGIMRDLLVAAGCGVRVAVSAEDAFIALRTFTPRLVLLDLMLPRMSGLMLARQLARGARGTDVVVVAVSAADAQTAESLVLEAGCVAFVPKPIEPATFAATVARYVERHVSAAEAR